MSKRDDYAERTEEKHTPSGDDHSTKLAFGIEADVLLIRDLVGEQDLI